MTPRPGSNLKSTHLGAECCWGGIINTNQCLVQNLVNSQESAGADHHGFGIRPPDQRDVTPAPQQNSARHSSGSTSQKTGSGKEILEICHWKDKRIGLYTQIYQIDWHYFTLLQFFKARKWENNPKGGGWEYHVMACYLWWSQQLLQQGASHGTHLKLVSQDFKVCSTSRNPMWEPPLSPLPLPLPPTPSLSVGCTPLAYLAYLQVASCHTETTCWLDGYGLLPAR